MFINQTTILKVIPVHKSLIFFFFTQLNSMQFCDLNQGFGIVINLIKHSMYLSNL